jgi:hypothetical protein
MFLSNESITLYLLYADLEIAIVKIFIKIRKINHSVQTVR